MAKEQKKMPQGRKTVIAILLALLIVSAGALIARVIYLNFFQENSTTVIVPDNLIGEDENITAPGSSGASSVPATDATESTAQPNESTAPTPSAPEQSTAAGSTNAPSDTPNSATVIELYRGQGTDNQPFRATDMLPGDVETRYFAVQVSHHADVTVYFGAEVTQQTKNLAQVLHIRVTHLENNKVIYDGTFADMNIDGYGETFAATQSTQTVAYYKVEVSLPTSTGNAYQAASLMADFNWCVKETGPLDPPATGDHSYVMLWAVVMCAALAMITILLFTKGREREVDDAAAN